MPESDLHKRQRAKNWTLFAILLALVIIFFALTVVKLSASPESREAGATVPTGDPAPPLRVPQN